MGTTDAKRIRSQTQLIADFGASKPASMWRDLLGPAGTTELKRFNEAAAVLVGSVTEQGEDLSGLSAFASAAQATLAEVLDAEETAQNEALRVVAECTAARDHLQTAALRERRFHRDEIEVMRLLQASQMVSVQSNSG
jgi:hypothetical protein